MNDQQTALWERLLLAAENYEAAKQKIEGWSIALDEGDPVDWKARVALDGLYKKKQKEYDRLQATREALIAVAIEFSHVGRIDNLEVKN